MVDIRFHDISYAQGLYDMDADKSPIVFMKMSGFYYGSKTGYYDVQAARNYNNAIRTGKLPGLYHFAGGADPVAEADFFIGACSPLAEGDLLILDYELTAEMSPPADPAAWCLAFVERVKERTGKYPLFYTYYAMLKQYGFDEVLKRCGLWVAHYGVKPEDTIPNCAPYLIHQFQGSPLDTNACFVELDVLKRYAYSANQPQPPVITPVPMPPVPEPAQPDEPPVEEPVDDPEPTPEPTTPPVVVVTPPAKATWKDTALRIFHTFWQSFLSAFALIQTSVLTGALGVHTVSEAKTFIASTLIATGSAVFAAVKNVIKLYRDKKL